MRKGSPRAFVSVSAFILASDLVALRVLKPSNDGFTAGSKISTPRHRSSIGPVSPRLVTYSWVSTDLFSARANSSQESHVSKLLASWVFINLTLKQIMARKSIFTMCGIDDLSR